MLSATVQRDIGAYKEKLAIFGDIMPEVRTLVSIIAGIAIAAVVTVPIIFIFGFSFSDVSFLWIAIVGMAFAVAYVKPLNMTFKEAIPLIMRERYATQPLMYKDNATKTYDALLEYQENHKTRLEKKYVKKEKTRYDKFLTKVRKYGAAEYLVARIWQQYNKQKGQESIQ